MKQFYAQPYNMEAKGFYFDDVDEFTNGMKTARNAFGQPVEEFEILYVGEDALDAAVFEALAVNQATIVAFCAELDQWDEQDKLMLIMAVGECGADFKIGGDVADLDVDIYRDMNLRELAEQFVDEGFFGDIPERLACYLNFDAIARDLGYDYTEITIAGSDYVYRGP